MSAPLVLVSHALCPYVQRAAIVLAEKGVPFERRDIDLATKPSWFLKVSPLGKTPVLLVGDVAIFESAVICEYLDETAWPRLHPQSALERARHRSWMEFGSALLNVIGAFYNAADEAALAARAGEIRTRLERLEEALGSGPYFAGQASASSTRCSGQCSATSTSSIRSPTSAFGWGCPRWHSGARRWRTGLRWRMPFERTIPNCCAAFCYLIRPQ